MSQHQYYPQLKWGPAEYESLMLLSQTTLSGFTPIIIIPDTDWDYENECYKKNLSSYLSDFGINLAASWRANRPVLLDVKYLDKYGLNRHYPLDMCIQDARVSGKEIIPIVSPIYSTNCIHAIRRNLIDGLTISIIPQTWHQFTSLVSHLNIHPSLVDVIINFGDIQSVAGSLEQRALSMVNALSGQAPWKDLILSSAAYPASQTGIPQRQVHRIPRHEYDLWMYVIQNFSGGRTPSFSNYPAASSTIANVNLRFMSQYVSVRYSNDTSRILVKGTAVKGDGQGQAKDLCTTLVSSPRYQVLGLKFSWGDNYIYQRSLGANRSDDSKEWHKVAHTHHITLVVRQLYQSAQTQPTRP